MKPYFLIFGSTLSLLTLLMASTNLTSAATKEDKNPALNKCVLDSEYGDHFYSHELKDRPSVSINYDEDGFPMVFDVNYHGHGGHGNFIALLDDCCHVMSDGDFVHYQTILEGYLKEKALYWTVDELNYNIANIKGMRKKLQEGTLKKSMCKNITIYDNLSTLQKQEGLGKVSSTYSSQTEVNEQQLKEKGRGDLQQNNNSNNTGKKMNKHQ